MMKEMLTPRGENQPFGGTWVFSAPWAHPFWQDYVIFMYDLTTPMEGRETLILRPGVTHEVVIYPVDPAHGVPDEWWVPTKLRLLSANHGYQFTAVDDDDAARRVRSIVALINSQMLSPDTDYTRAWDALFRDGVSLRRGGR